MYIVLSVVLGLTIANKLLEIHNQYKICDQAILDELKIIK